MAKSVDNPQVIQAIWHKASLFKLTEAEKWCLDHDFKIDTYRKHMDDDGNLAYHIHAQFDPEEAIEDTWAFISDDFPEGITASVCQRKEKVMHKVDPNKMVHKTGTQSADDPFEFIMSDETVDRMGDVIVAKGWQLNEFKQNPIALGFHNHAKPIGLWENVRRVGKELRGRLKVAAVGTSAEIDTIRSLLEQRILKAVSVGFTPLEWEDIKDEKNNWTGYRFNKCALNECSVVSVPANPNALAVAKSCGLSKDQFTKLFGGSENMGQNAAPLAKIEKAIGTANKIAGCPTS